jgi:hypothetical protein
VSSTTPARIAATLAVALVLAACSAAAPGATGTPPGTSGPQPSPAGTGFGSAEAAVAAIAAVDSSFLGYAARDPDLIGQSAWYEAKPVGDGFEVTFFRGEGDCPAGCIDRAFVKFFVGRDGRVEKRCEWGTEMPAATPC